MTAKKDLDMVSGPYKTMITSEFCSCSFLEKWKNYYWLNEIGIGSYNIFLGGRTNGYAKS